MCSSHANRLPFRLTCLAGGVQRGCLCQRDVFDSLISRVMFPSTCFCGILWCLGAPIAFCASSVLFQMPLFAYWTYKSMSSFGLTKQLHVFLFFISRLLWKIGDAGHRPRTFRTKRDCSTICATSTLRKRGANDIWSLSSVNAMAERSLLLQIVLKLVLSIRVINPYVSHMSMGCPLDWHASLVGSKGAVYVRGMSLVHFSVE